MRSRRNVEVAYVGEHFVLGRTSELGGIWDKQAAFRRRPGQPIQSFPLTDEGWEAAREQFSAWEPNAELFITTGDMTTAGRTRLLLAIAAAVIVVAGGTAFAITVTSHSGSAPRRTPHSVSSSIASSTDAVPTTVIGVSPVGSGFLASGDGFVDFIQWTNDHGQLSGSAQAIGVSGQVPDTQTTNETLTVSGSLNGSTLSLSFDGGAATFGTFTGNGFTLNFPQPDGTLAPVPFHHAAAAAFDDQVTTIRQNVANANAREANAEAIQQARQRIDADAQTVNSDLGNLAAAADAATNDAQAVAGKSLKTEATDLAATYTDKQAVIAEAHQSPDGNSGQVCSDAAGVSSDAAGVASDAAGVGSDAAGVSNDISAVRDDIAGLSTDFAQLLTDEASLPGYQPQNAPTQSEVTRAAAAANAAIVIAFSVTNTDIDRANANVTAAYQYAAAASQAGNCGPPDATPDTVRHIS